MKSLVYSVLIVLVGLFYGGKCHVSMTYPPARQFSLDFLNTFWTKQPCGMPKGRYRTTLMSGTSFNATWHLGYAHNGGYRLELLDKQENWKMDLTPNEQNGFYLGRMTAQWHLVDLPRNLTCHDCSIRLLRQVPEFSPDFQFLSCADVDIVSRQNYVETCSGHGYYSGGKCNCYSRFWGDKCQYEDECENDGDCSYRGKCIYLGGTALPRRQCFCSPTHFGSHCSQQNPPTVATSPSNLDLSKHVRAKLSEKMTLLFRIFIGPTAHLDEIEFVVQMNGTSFAGLGWKPTDLGPICKSWPFYPDALLPGIHGRLRRGKRSSDFTITKSVDHSEAHEDTPPHYLSAYQSDEAIFYRTIPKSSTAGSYANKVVTASDVRFAEENRLVQARVQSHRNPNPFTTRRPRPRVTTTTPTTTRRPTSPPLPSRQIHHTAGEQSQQSFVPSEWAAQDPFTPMDCSDIVMGAARGHYHRIRDAYARGRHTPKVDEEWGGRDSLTAASGWEKNGVTTLIFRRRLVSTDGPDHSLDGDMQVIWSRGQVPGEYVSEVSHRLERHNPTVSEFYTADEYKYHGLGPQRGLLHIDFGAVRKEYATGAFS